MVRLMRAGILAAGLGARLRPDADPTGTPKALTRVAGRPLIDWILSDLERASVEQVVVIVNEHSTSIRDHVERSGRASVIWLVETTASSMHSFLRVLEELARDGDDGPFLITAVDTIAPAGTFRQFAQIAAAAPSADIVFGLTTFVDDENPLRIDVADHSTAVAEVTSVGDGPYATAGYFLVRSSVLREAGVARASSFNALRVYLRHLFDRGYRMSGVRMADSIDVDRPSDVATAERLLRASLS
jgi:NDP-sugar pyrophosphorylase family protein